MKNYTQQSGDRKNNKTAFQDPVKINWVWIGLVILILGMTPFWPITGSIFGFPRWAVFAVLMSSLTSLFIAGVIIFIWKDPEQKNEKL